MPEPIQPFHCCHILLMSRFRSAISASGGGMLDSWAAPGPALEDWDDRFQGLPALLAVKL
jgi:hypothetical protein